MKINITKRFLLSLCLMTLTLLCGENKAWGQIATLPVSFNDGKGSLPNGFTQSGLDDDYSKEPKLKFNSAGDYLIVHFDSDPSNFSCLVKQNGDGSTSNKFEIQYSTDGSTYTTFATVSNIGSGNTQTVSYDFSSLKGVRYIKWIYTKKRSGNYGLGKISIEASTSTPAPTFSLPGGTYYGDQSVSISVEDLGSGSILYTTDDTDPKTNGTEYTEAIPLPVGTHLTLKAVAKYGEEFSEVTEATYDIKEMGNESITFTGTKGAFDNLGGSGYKTGTYTFTDDNKNNHSFSVTGAMKNNDGLQLRGSSGKAVSPIYEYPYGYVITVTTSTNNVNLSSGPYSATGTNGSVELEIPETSASFTISTGSSYAVVSSITITPKISNLDPTELRFPKSSISLGRVNNFTGQQATLMSKDVELENKSLTYTSSNEAVATVDNNGSVTLIGFGETTITAEFAGDKNYSASSASYTLTYLDEKTNTTLSFEQTNYEVRFGNSFEAPIPTLSSNDVPLGEKAFSYKSSDPAVATVDENGIVTLTGIGVTTITATFAGDEDYNGSSASYTLTVKDPKNLSVTFDFNQPEKYGYSEPTSGNYTVIGKGNTILSDEVTITNTKDGDTETRFHNKSGFITLRAYTNAELTISVPAGYFINSIEITGSEGEYSLGDKTTTNGSISWNGSAQAVTLNNVTAKSFLETMTVNYRLLYFSDTEDLKASLPETELADQTITLKRNLYSGWNTFCVPFALTQAQLEEAYGSGAVAKYLSGVTTDGAAATLHFTPEEGGGIEANKAYLLYLTADVTEAKTFSGVTLEPAGKCTTTVNTDNGYYTFQGILAPTTLATNDTQYFLNSTGTAFVLPRADSSQMKATRAYIIVPTPAGSAQGRQYRFDFNGTTTAIDNVTVSGMEDGAWHTISGIRINRPAAKGVYIHNGRKVIVK